MAGSKEQVEKVEVIPLGEGHWWVSSSKGGGEGYNVRDTGQGLSCDCIAGVRGTFCRHKRAVSVLVEQKGMETERRLSGVKEQPAVANNDQANSKMTQNGYVFGEVTSALQKSIRRSDEREAVYWAVELYKTAPHYLVKRLLVIASEDIGMADPQTVGIVNNLAVGWAEAKKFSWYVSAHQPIMMTMLLARAPKSTEVEDAIAVAELDVKEGKKRPIPPDAIDMHTDKGKKLAAAAGKTYDDQCRDWYQSRLNAGIEMNQYTKELEARRPQWFHDPRLPDFFEEK